MKCALLRRSSFFGSLLQSILLACSVPLENGRSFDSYLSRTCLHIQQRNNSSHGYETDINTQSHNRYGTLFATQYGGRLGHVVVWRQTHNLYCYYVIDTIAQLIDWPLSPRDWESIRRRQSINRRNRLNRAPLDNSTWYHKVFMCVVYCWGAGIHPYH